MRQLGADLAARARFDQLIDPRGTASLRHPRDGQRPDFGPTVTRGLLRIDQRLDIGGVEPQLGQRLQALTRRDRLRQEHAVDPARAGAGDDVGQHAEPQVGFVFDLAEQLVIDALG